MSPAQLADGLLATIVDAVEAVSESFDRWNEPFVHGPGLYVLVVEGTHSEYSDPMGDNYWPVEECPTVTDDIDQFVETATAVGKHRDGAIVVGTDGHIEPQMVRHHDLQQSEDGRSGGPPAVDYEDWMGARHMSAIEASTRPNVAAAVTLSEEDGRVSMFVDGEHRQ